MGTSYQPALRFDNPKIAADQEQVLAILAELLAEIALDISQADGGSDD